MDLRHLWRLHDDIVPLHTHDDRPVLVHHDEESGRCEVLGGPREASEIVADRTAAPRGVSRRAVLGSLGALGALGAVSAQPRYAFAAEVPGSAVRTGARAGVSGVAGGVGVSGVSGVAGLTRDVLVVVFLRGAVDGLQVVVPYAESAYYAARPTIAVPEKDLIRLDDRFGFHPGMAALSPMWQAGELALVHAAGNPDANRSHFDAQIDMERAAPANVRSGWLGRHLSSVSTTRNLLRVVTMGERAVLAASTTFPTAAIADTVESFDIESWEGFRDGVATTLRRLYGNLGGGVGEAATMTFGGIDALAAARATKAGTAPYPATSFGQQLREVARLIKSNAPLEAACLDVGDWDMHAHQGGALQEGATMRRALVDLSVALAAFRTDLGTAWQRTTVVTMTEFGRRVEENSNEGTDHGHGGLMMLAGGQVAGGRVHGVWPGLSPSALDDGDLAVANDYRQVLGEILNKRLATPDLDAVFPGLVPAPLGVIR